MSAELDHDYLASPAEADGSEGSFAAPGLTCSLQTYAFSGFREFDMHVTGHHFGTVRELQSGGRLVNHWSFDGQHFATRRLREHDSCFVPLGQRWICKVRGSARLRTLECDFDPTAFAALQTGGQAELQAHAGVSLVPPALLDRLEALCRAPGAYPRAYADALAVILAYELWRAHGRNLALVPSNEKVDSSRFKAVLDHIEATLENDTSLSELASLMGLSVSHFSHAFRAAFGVAPYRYILRRRIDKAKALLRGSDVTVGAVSMRVGFSSQSRFTQSFVRQTGITPSAYRLEQLR